MPGSSDPAVAAVKAAVDIVEVLGAYLSVERFGSKFRALCPFHDDHNPSMQIDPERQTFKCWVCDAGGDVIEFVRKFERVEFPEALRMLADRAGIALDKHPRRASHRGLPRERLLSILEWAALEFRRALSSNDSGAAEARDYLDRRGLNPDSLERFQLGFAPDKSDWILVRGAREGYPAAELEAAGLLARGAEGRGAPRDRFRGRLMFPIWDERGRVIAFGARVLPSLESRFEAAGKRVAKYLNSGESELFRKRRTLYAAHLARDAARREKSVVVVEGYTDVIAAHQVGLSNTVGTLGTALTDDHVGRLRGLAEFVHLVFDGDDAGRAAADRALEIFLSNKIDVRALNLPDGVDPCDFLLANGADAFRALLDQSPDPFTRLVDRAAQLHGLERPESLGSGAAIERQRAAVEWVLAQLAKIPVSARDGGDLKVARALDMLQTRFRVPIANLNRALADLRKTARRRVFRRDPAEVAADAGADAVPTPDDVRARARDATTPPAPEPAWPNAFDPIDREIVRLALEHPESVPGALVTRVSPASLRDARLREILETVFDVGAEGLVPEPTMVSDRLTPPAREALTKIMLPIDAGPAPPGLAPPDPLERLAGVLARFLDRDRLDRVNELRAALRDARRDDDPEGYEALRNELFRLSARRVEAPSARYRAENPGDPGSPLVSGRLHP